MNSVNSLITVDENYLPYHSLLWTEQTLDRKLYWELDVFYKEAREVLMINCHHAL